MTTNAMIMQVDLDLIDPNPWQPRASIDNSTAKTVGWAMFLSAGAPSFLIHRFGFVA